MTLKQFIKKYKHQLPESAQGKFVMDLFLLIDTPCSECGIRRKLKEFCKV